MNKKPFPQFPIKSTSKKIISNNNNVKVESINISNFYLVYLITECNGKIYYRDVSISCNALYIEGIEFYNKIYLVNNLSDLGKKYINDKYEGYDDKIKLILKSGRLPFYGIIKLLISAGYQINTKFNKKSNDIVIRNIITIWEDEIDEKIIKSIGKKFYCFELNRIKTEYRKNGNIGKI